MLFGLAEQPDRAGRSVVARSAVEAIALAERGDGAPLAVAACGPALTGPQVAALTAQADPAAGVAVVVDEDGSADGRRSAARAFHVLDPAVTRHPDRPGPVLAITPDGADTWPLVEVVVTGRVDWAAGTFTTAAGREVAAQSVRAMLHGQPDEIAEPLAAVVRAPGAGGPGAPG
ncbi:hypothetical protein O7626_05570 [Micromonospora sp. WMMD1102]|uniref:hypothetical protein n=1 Tax=Micromonospora sp. WMMD1102 TaxID=3016105 RepID=UPI002414F06B|nr:hypothetical protein [Micromonospora sp. WMMD1102]MDG4785406.1 hypothetical protein [Micromonospora sp. WMMD1102]